MARLPELIPAPELSRDQLLTIPGVGTRNITHVENVYEDVVIDQHNSVQELTPIHFAEKGKVSLDTAEAIVDWIQRHVEDTWTQDDFFGDDEIDWEDEVEEEPVYALAFDPLAYLDALADENADLNPFKIRAVAGYLRGEVAPYHQNGVN